ncbi:MAG: hypothetical protein ACK5U4_07170 [Rhodospirillales bacterium]
MLGAHRGFGRALGGHRKAEWEAYVFRRRMQELCEASKIFAVAPGVRRLFDPKFEAGFGVNSAGSAAAFEKDEAAMGHTAFERRPQVNADGRRRMRPVTAPVRPRAYLFWAFLSSFHLFTRLAYSENVRAIFRL